MRSERRVIPIRWAGHAESASEMTWSFLVYRRYEPVNGMGGYLVTERCHLPDLATSVRTVVLLFMLTCYELGLSSRTTGPFHYIKIMRTVGGM